MKVERLLPAVLILMGMVLLVYVGSQYAQMFFEQRRLAEEWKRQIAEEQTPGKPAAAQQVDSNLVRLIVPKIDLDSFVVEGTGHKALLLGPGHMRDTALPGEAGNSVITAHRDTFFRHLHELQKGDEVLVQRGAKTYRYVVSGKKIVEPTDVSVTQPTRDSQLTLVTCYPTYYIGPAPQRLVVFTRFDNAQPVRQTSAGSAWPHLTVGASTQ